jgi:hypothetical protein
MAIAPLSLSIGYALAWEHATAENCKSCRSKYVSDETPAYPADAKIKGITMIRKYFAPALMAAVFHRLPGSARKILSRTGCGDEVLRLY